MNTHAIVIRNAGNIAAKNIRVGHNIFPDISCTVSPPIEYEVKKIENGTELIFPIMVPKEQITISYLYFPPVVCSQINTYVKSDEGFARVIHVIPSPQLPRWLEIILYFLLFIGGVATINYLIKLILFFKNGLLL